MADEIDLDDDRVDRYRDKLDRLEERLDDMEAWLADTDEELLANKERRLALYKVFQEAVEAVTDICAMYLSDHRHGIGDDDSNIETAAGRLFDEELERPLIRANGLRNRVVHDYSGFDDGQAVASMRDHVDALRAFLAEVRAWTGSR